MPNTVPDAPVVEVALGVVEDAAGRVLVGQRGADQHLPGRLELPGGKLEPGEDPVEALTRELLEETGLTVHRAVPCLQLEHDYGDRRVRLHVFRVHGHDGRVAEREGRVLSWQDAASLDPAAFPAANAPILRMLRLPPFLLVTPDPGTAAAIDATVKRVATRLQDGDVGLLQIRAPSLGFGDYRSLVRELMAQVRPTGVEVLLNAPPDWLDALPAAGIHLPERRWRGLTRRPEVSGPVGVSVHDVTGAREAAHRVAPDLAVAGPVRPTSTHPGAPVLGWTGLAELAAASPVSIYALGGLEASDLSRARASGACGVAAIRGLLERSGA